MANANASLTIFSQPFARDQLEALGDAGRLHVLDAGVEVFDVLADDDDIEIATGECGLHAGKLADRADVAVRLEQGSERDVRAAVAVSYRRLERTFEDDVRPLDRLDGLLGNSGDDAFLERAGAGFAPLELNVCASGLYDCQRGFDNFRADTVAREYGYLLFCGCHQRKLVPLGSRVYRARSSVG